MSACKFLGTLLTKLETDWPQLTTIITVHGNMLKINLVTYYIHAVRAKRLEDGFQQPKKSIKIMISCIHPQAAGFGFK